ncbi:HMG-Y-related protein A-like [Abrus precatorius]|uniref:HMG-Y-related protein A n=1 Tax=Abrus precatorius TaxID=3816 RepID=A0A8B8JZP9_ABRPR|nr:HMG-Y-related protein A-like [Abrus precatorius]
MATEEVNKPSSLPPYPEMIMKAIEAQGDNNGANKSVISKYIESAYGELPPSHSTLLSNHLNKMKESGEIVFWKNNYMKSDPNAPPRRGRGRPPKPKEPLPPGTILSSPRPRGRPPKDPNAPPKSSSVKVSSGRPRGRPKKIARTMVTSTTGSTGRPRGRPPKVKPQLTEVSVEQ